MIPLSVPHLRGNEWKYVKECLDTEWVSSAGQFVRRLEREICDLTGAKYAVACVNGTSALQVALKVTGVAAGDEVIVPSLSFIAPVNAAHYLGAAPVFMDSEEYYTIDVDKTFDFIHTQTRYHNNCTYNKKTGRRIAAIIVVHVFGNAVNLYELLDSCKERNIRIIEDAAESVGTFYTRGRLAGKYTGTVGDIGCYSFNGNKIITTGGGGMIVTNEQSYEEKARYLTTQAKDDKVHYIHNEVGYNYRLTNIQAALGVAQLEQLQGFIEAKRRGYELYKRRIDRIAGLRIADVPNFARSNHWFYCLRIEERTYGKTRDQLMHHLENNGIQTRPIWHLNHLQRPYRNSQTYTIEKAYDLLKETLNLPCSVGISESEIAQVIETIENGKA